VPATLFRFFVYKYAPFRFFGNLSSHPGKSI
jgi:hypothetical protein